MGWAMTRALLLLTLASCGPARLGGDHLTGNPSTLTEETLDRAISAAIEAGDWTTDPRLHGHDEHTFDGYTIYTRDTFAFEHYGRAVLGWCQCATRTMVIGTPASGHWANSALVHEMFHVMQGCQDVHPVDANADTSHGNWWRDGIYSAAASSRASGQF